MNTLATTPKGRRIDTSKEFLCFEEDSMVQGLYRWRDGKSRERDVSCIVKDVRTLIEMSTWISESRFISMPVDTDDDIESRIQRLTTLNKIKNSLLGASVGITNVCATYDDVNITATMTPIKELIRSHTEYLEYILSTIVT